MIYLDTHVAVWLFAGLVEKISEPARRLINEQDLFISPIVRLELQYLFEIERITRRSDDIVSDLVDSIGLQICDKPFDRIVHEALKGSWTRDPFDRLIVANAALENTILLSKDERILAHYHHAKW